MSADGENAMPLLGVEVTYVSLLIVVVIVTGEIDMGAADQLRATIMAAIDAQPLGRSRLTSPG